MCEAPCAGPVAIFCIMLTMLVGAFYERVRSSVGVPHSLIMMLWGGLLGVAAYQVPSWGGSLVIVNWDPDLFLHVFLPLLIFSAGADLKLKVFNRVTWSALWLAGPGVLIGAFATGGFWWAITTAGGSGLPEWTFVQSSLLGATLAATDPVAVMATLHDLEADAWYATLCDAESLLNDGTAIALFQIIKGILVQSDDNAVAAAFRIVLVPIPLGIAFGFVIHTATRYSLNSAVVTGGVQIASAYVAFYVAEILSKTSGVLTLLVAGIYMARNRARSPRSDAEVAVRAVWQQLVWVGNTLLFAALGFLVVVKSAASPHFSGTQIGYIVVLYIFLNLLRFVIVLTVWPVANWSATHEHDRMTWQRAVMLSYSGLRGGIALVLSIAIAQDSKFKDDSGFASVFFVQVAGIVVLTCVINGWTSGLVVSALRLNTKEVFSFYSMRLALTELKILMQTKIDQMKRASCSPLQSYEVVSWMFVRAATVHRIEEMTLHVEHEARKMAVFSSAAESAVVERQMVAKHNPAVGSPVRSDTNSTGLRTPFAAHTSVSRDLHATTVLRHAHIVEGKRRAIEQQRGAAGDSSVFCGGCCSSYCCEDGDDADGDNNAADARAKKTNSTLSQAALQDHNKNHRKSNASATGLGASDSDVFDCKVDEEELDDGARLEAGVNNVLVNSEEDEDNEAAAAAREPTGADASNVEDATPSATAASGGGAREGLRLRARGADKKDNNNNSTNQKNASKTSLSFGRGGSSIDVNSAKQLKSAALKAGRMTLLLNESSERFILCPIILRAMRRSIWMQYNSGLTYGTTTMALSEFLDSMSMQSKIFSGADVIEFICSRDRLSMLDWVEEKVAPQYFAENQNSFLVECSIVFTAIMRQLCKTLPLLHAKHANINAWITWAKFVCEEAVDFEREMLTKNVLIGVHINSRRASQAVIEHGRAAVAALAVQFGLSTHQKAHLGEQLFDISHEALVGDMKATLAHELRIAQGLETKQQQEELEAAELAATASASASTTSPTTTSGTVAVLVATPASSTAIIPAASCMETHFKEVLRNTQLFFHAEDEDLDLIISEVIGHSNNCVDAHAEEEEKNKKKKQDGGKDDLEMLDKSLGADGDNNNNNNNIKKKRDWRVVLQQGEPLMLEDDVALVVFGTMDRVCPRTGKRTGRFHGADFFGLNSFLFGKKSAKQYLAYEHTQLVLVPHAVLDAAMARDARLRHHIVLQSALDLISPIFERAYPFAALTAAQRHAIVTQAHVIRIHTSEHPAQFGPRDAVFLLRGGEAASPEDALSLTPAADEAAAVAAAAASADPPLLTSVRAPQMLLLPEQYNVRFAVGSVLVQVQDARLTSQQVRPCGITFVDVAHVALDVAFTSFTETAQQRDAILAVDVLLQELHNYTHVAVAILKLIKPLLTLPKQQLHAVSPPLRAAASASAAEFARRVREKADHDANVLAGVDVEAVERVCSCITELISNLRIWLLQRHAGNLNRLYVSHVLSAYFDLVVRRSHQWAPAAMALYEMEHAKRNPPLAPTADQLELEKKQRKQFPWQFQPDPIRNAVDWSNEDLFFQPGDLVPFMRDAKWLSDDDWRVMDGWNRLNVEGNTAEDADVDEPIPALISATLCAAEARTAVFHARARSRAVAAALRDLPHATRELLATQQLFSRARVQVSHGRSLPGGTSGHDVVAPLAQSERASDSELGTERNAELTQVAAELTRSFHPSHTVDRESN